jgi:diaminopimelate decarboxylase
MLTDIFDTLLMSTQSYIQQDISPFPSIEYKSKELIRKRMSVKTPFYIVHSKEVSSRIQKLDALLASSWGSHAIAYSFKTNYALASSNILRPLNTYAEVVSGNEYHMALKYGYAGPCIIFNGPYKKDRDLYSAIINNSLINVDNMDELMRIAAIADAHKILVKIGIRLKTKILDSPESRFGFSIDTNEAHNVVSYIHTHCNLSLIGIHSHIGSDIGNSDAFEEASIHIASFIQTEKTLQKRLGYIDIGGGVNSHGSKPKSRTQYNYYPLDEYISKSTTPYLKLYSKKRPMMIVEPGRYCIDDATQFICRVIHKKDMRFKQLLTVDATTAMIPSVHYRMPIIRVFDRTFTEKPDRKVWTKIYGASCREDDVLYRGWLPRAHKDDLLIFYAMGAYNESLSPAFIYRKPVTLFL